MAQSHYGQFQTLFDYIPLIPRMLAKKSRFQMYFAMTFLLPDLNYIQLLYLSSELQRRNDFKGISVGTHYFVHYQPLPHGLSPHL